MLKLRKILLILTIVLILTFALQKGANFYIERQINMHLSPYDATANLEGLNKLTLSYKGLSLSCKMKIRGKTLVITPIKTHILTRLLPDEIKVSLKRLKPCI